MEPVPETRSALEEIGALISGIDLTEAVQAGLNQALASIAECVAISITVLDAGLTFTFLRSGDIAAAVDAAQYLDDGPCLETIRSGDEIEVDDVLDEDRWQLFSQASAAYGIRSSLSLPLRHDGVIFGSANFYGATTTAFMGEEAVLARAFGGRIEEVTINADLSMSSLDRSRRASAVLAENALVDQALGVLVAQYGITFEQAQQRLQDAAERACLSEMEVARAIIRSLQV